MSEVNRYWIHWNDQLYVADKNGDLVMATDFDRVTAERDALQALLTAADERVDVLQGLLLQTNELLYAIQGDPGAVPSSSIDAMRGDVFTALKPAEGGGDEAMSFAQIAQFNDDHDQRPDRDE